jgi:pimeloyl-ACP methyl ester carboxylesterase
MGEPGATVDAIRLDNPHGVLALALGRGVHLVLLLVPMLLGASVGESMARRAPPRIIPFAVRWVPAGLVTVGLAVLLVLPASTPPILGADGAPLANTVSELTTVTLGGRDQAVLIRGYSVDNPVILYLAGGPGQSDLPFVRAVQSDLERDFVVVAWDQPGTGKSYASLDPNTLTVDQVVADTIELASYLRDRFDEERIYLSGVSWGTILGVLAVQRAPELYHAWIGAGQMVDPLETTRRLHQEMLDLAARTDDAELAAKMASFGDPPYRHILAGAFVMGYYEALYKPYTPAPEYVERIEQAGIGPWGVLAGEYDLMDKANVLRGLIDFYSIMWPQIQGIDFRRDVPRLDVPVYLLDGQAELASRRDLALEWHAGLDAPIKRIFSFRGAAHNAAMEQCVAFHRIMVETVLPETYGRPD